MKAVPLLLILPALLVGCSKEPGAGVSAESSDSTSRESKNSLARSREVTAGNTAKASIKMPAAGLIADAAMELLLQDGYHLDQVKQVFIKGAQYDRWTPLAEVPNLDPSQIKDWPAVLADYDKQLAGNPTSADTVRAKRACAELGSKGDIDGSRTCFKNFYRVLVSAATVAVANSPEQGWPVNPRGKAAAPFIIAMTNSAEFSNLLETELAGALQGRALRDPADAKVQIRAALFAMKPETIEAIAEQARSTSYNNLKHPTLDMASGKGITWTATGATYSNMGTAWTIAKNGMTWFGDGRLSGKTYELDLETSVVANMTKRQSIDNATTSTSSEQQKADAQVK